MQSIMDFKPYLRGEMIEMVKTVTTLPPFPYMKNEYVKFLFQPELFWLFNNINKQYYYFLKNNITGGDKESNFEVDLTPNIS